MNRFQKLFKTKNSPVLSVYFTAGFPGIQDTAEIIRQLSDAGIDMIEIGIPFSDPMADGPVIQHSSQIALNNGMTLPLMFEQLKDIRKITDIPLVLMGYLNPVLQYGFEAFCTKAAETGIDGLIIPDLPMREYLNNFQGIVQKSGLENILLITPETSEERIRMIDANSHSFIYMVSTASITGAKKNFGENTVAYFKRVQEMNLINPVLTGFGVSNRETFETACQYSRGAITGSVFIRCLQQTSDISKAVNSLLETVHS